MLVDDLYNHFLSLKESTPTVTPTGFSFSSDHIEVLKSTEDGKEVYTVRGIATLVEDANPLKELKKKKWQFELDLKNLDTMSSSYVHMAPISVTYKLKKAFEDMLNVSE